MPQLSSQHTTESPFSCSQNSSLLFSPLLFSLPVLEALCAERNSSGDFFQHLHVGLTGWLAGRPIIQIIHLSLPGSSFVRWPRRPLRGRSFGHRQQRDAKPDRRTFSRFINVLSVPALLLLLWFPIERIGLLDLASPTCLRAQSGRAGQRLKLCGH